VSAKGRGGESPLPEGIPTRPAVGRLYRCVPQRLRGRTRLQRLGLAVSVQKRIAEVLP